MKKYKDIENMKNKDIILNGEVTRHNNISAFSPNDTIMITEKIDGSNASITLDENTNTISIFSRTQELSLNNNLKGFYQFIQNQPLFSQWCKDYPNLILFGEWMASKKMNKILYNEEVGGKWYIFSIWNKELEYWVDPREVKKMVDTYFAAVPEVEFVKVLYQGPFISWDACSQYLHCNSYGEVQEGIVVVNCDKIEKEKELFRGQQAVLKIVNEEFKESMADKIKVVDPEVQKERNRVKSLIGSIVTENRVEKILGKLQIDGILPKEILPSEMKTIARVLPKAVYEDCLKEEPEIMEACGDAAGKVIGSLAMAYARNLLL